MLRAGPGLIIQFAGRVCATAAGPGLGLKSVCGPGVDFRSVLPFFSIFFIFFFGLFPIWDRRIEFSISTFSGNPVLLYLLMVCQIKHEEAEVTSNCHYSIYRFQIIVKTVPKSRCGNGTMHRSKIGFTI